jgi:hypothetical protein
MSETLDLTKNVSPLRFSTTKILHVLLEVGWSVAKLLPQLLRDTRVQLGELPEKKLWNIVS